MEKPVYHRVLLKISGEALGGEKGTGFDEPTMDAICGGVKKAHDLGVQIGIVVGGGNFWRGRSSGKMERTLADKIGMLATVMNALAVSDKLEQLGVETEVFTSITMPQVAPAFTRKEEDIVQEMFVGSTHDYVLFVTDRGRLFRIKGYTIAEGSRTSKGMNIVNLLQLAEGEKVTNMICQSKDAEQSGGYVTMVTKQGLIKRTPLEQYANIRKSGLIGIALNEGDALAWTRLTSGHDMLIVATRNGQAIRFNEENARPMGRNGHGVRAIRLAEGDEVVGVCICREGGTVLTVTENGKGRRSDIDTYRITARGGKGIRNYDVSRDKVAAVKIVDDVDDVLLSSQEGIIIRLHANEIPLQSRYGSGVRVMRLGENDKVMVLARTDHDDEAQTEKIDASEAEAEPTAEQLAEMEAADAAAATEAPEADPEEKE